MRDGDASVHSGISVMLLNSTPAQRFFSEPTCTSGRALVPLASMDRSSLYDIHDVHA